jgi:hypothetical protein
LQKDIALPACAGHLNSREEHYRRENELLALADNEEGLEGKRALQGPSR